MDLAISPGILFPVRWICLSRPKKTGVISVSTTSRKKQSLFLCPIYRAGRYGTHERWCTYATLYRKPKCQSRQRGYQHRQGQDNTDFEIVSPGNYHAFVLKYMQPQQGGEASDRCELGSQIATNDIGVNHCLLDGTGCLTAFDG